MQDRKRIVFLAGFKGATMTDIEEIKKDVKSILEMLNGNGKLGLCAKVTILWGVGVFLVISVAGLILKAIILG